MKLEYTDKYFPKTYDYLKKTYGSRQTKATLPTFIKDFSLGGLSIFDPEKTKHVKVVSNDVDNSDDKAISAVKKFNDNLDLMSKDYCLFVIPLHSSVNAVMLDHDIYDNLNEFVTSHFNINSHLRKYVNVDKLVLNNLKNGKLKVAVQRDDNYLVYDIYEPVYKFNYSLSDLETFELASLHRNAKELNEIPSDVARKLQKDLQLFNHKIKPILPLLMLDDRDYYNQAVKHGRLLHLACIAYRAV